MSDQIEDGGSAFPTTPENKTRLSGNGGTGMTLRDWFAGQAMQGLVSKMTENREEAINNGVTDPAWEAELSYEIADAMLKVRGAKS